MSTLRGYYRFCSFVLFAVLSFSFEVIISNANASDLKAFSINDYFKVKRISELALSSDGRMAAYVVEYSPLEQNKTVRSIYINATEEGAEPSIIDEIQDATNLAWIPGTHELAFLLRRGGVGAPRQVYTYNIHTKKIAPRTQSASDILRFKFASDGQSLAWISRPYDHSPQKDSRSASIYDRIYHGESGVVFDYENTNFYAFVSPETRDYTERSKSALWVLIPGGDAFEVKALNSIKDFHWKSDGSSLSVTYVSKELSPEPYVGTFTSIGIVDISTGSVRTILASRPPHNGEKLEYYSGGEWVLDQNKIYIRRHTEKYYGILGFAEWSLIDLDKEQEPQWRELEIYFGDSDFIPISENVAVSNKTIRAHKSLFEITTSGIHESRLLQGVKGAVSSVRLSSDFTRAAFVNEDLTRPPEVFIWDSKTGIRQLTYLNDDIAQKQMPKAREVIWESSDGTTVQGWLFEPNDDKSIPRPLITFVHGGPSLAMSNHFAQYFISWGGIWPYPLEVYALNGMAVFIPNYRGTRSFGEEFADFTVTASPDKEPVEDIVSGIEYLIAEGIADRDRLAISGHSHGGWLAPLVMTKMRSFIAGSFSEGFLNKIAHYSIMPMRITKSMDRAYDVSLADDPQRYISLSPELHLKGLEAAVLFEAGAKSMAVGMIGAPNAAKRAGMPAEFIVYPKTRHNIRLPHLKLESAQRNLDWFNFWLNNYEQSDPNKVDQYDRWKAMQSTKVKKN